MKVLVPENVLVPLPLNIIFPLPDKTPVKELFCALLISKVAPEATAIFPADALFLPQSPFQLRFVVLVQMLLKRLLFPILF